MKDNFRRKKITFIFIGNEAVSIQLTISSASNENLKASTFERVNNEEQTSSEASVKENKGEKRPLDEHLNEEDTPISERINKRVHYTEKENDEQLTETSQDKLDLNKMKDDGQQSTTKKRIKQSSSAQNPRKRSLPSTRLNRQSKATWVRKYSIEDCYIQLDQCNLIYDKGKD